MRGHSESSPFSVSGHSLSPQFLNCTRHIYTTFIYEYPPPPTRAIIILKFDQCGFTILYYVWQKGAREFLSFINNEFLFTFIGFQDIWLVGQLVTFPMNFLNQKHYVLQTWSVSRALEHLKLKQGADVMTLHSSTKLKYCWTDAYLPLYSVTTLWDRVWNAKMALPWNRFVKKISM